MREKPTYEELERKVLQLKEEALKRMEAEKALRESEARYRELFISNPNPMWIYDLESLAFLDVNNAAISHYGYSREEFLSMSLKDIRPLEDLPRLINNVNAVGDGLDNAGTWRHIKKDGGIIDVEITSHVLQFHQRRAELVLACDITARKRAEDAMNAFFDQSLVMLYIADMENFKIVRANEEVIRITGRTKEEIFATPFIEFIHPEDRESTMEAMAQLVAGEPMVGFQNRHLTADGKIRLFEWNAVSDIERKLVYAMAQDVTERKRIEKKMRLSLEKYEKAFQAAPIWVVLSAVENGQYMEVNESFLNTMGYKREEAIGKTSLELNTWVDSKDRDRIIRQVEESGGVRNFEVQRRTKSGKIIDTLFSTEILHLEDKPVMISVTQEITEKKKAEAEKEKLQAQLRQAQKMESVGRLAGGVAHDFNNMLGVILGRTELLLQEMKKEDPRYADLREIYTAGRRSADLTRQLLAFARKQAISPKVLDLNDTIEGMLKMLRRLIGEDIDLVWKPNTSVGPVKMDPAQVDQILANFSVNARDAISGTGKVTIETDAVVFDQAYCETHEGFQPGHFVMLAFSDDGYGMDKEILNNIFEPFFTTKKDGKGTGLGLATIYGIVKQNNGFINVYSEVGQGTTFKIYLPVSGEKVEVESESFASASAKGSETVLLAEDEDAVLRLGKTALEQFGYKVLTANTPGKALEIAEKYEGPIQLLITDVVMPEMNGKELKERIKKLRPHIKVLFMSGYTGNVIVHRGIIENNVHFLQKPFSIHSLTSKVREVLERTNKR